MNFKGLSALIILALIFPGCDCKRTAPPPSAVVESAKPEDGFRAKFDVPPADFASVGRNKYWILEPGYESVYEGREDGKEIRLTITVLNETRQIEVIETRVVVEN